MKKLKEFYIKIKPILPMFITLIVAMIVLPFVNEYISLYQYGGTLYVYGSLALAIIIQTIWIKWN